MGKATLLRDIAAKIAEKGKPFYSAAEKAAQELPRTKGTGAEFMRELEKTKGVKPAEIHHRKLDEIKSKPKMTKEEFVKEVQARPAAKVEEKVLREPTQKDLEIEAEKLMQQDAENYVNETFGQRKFKDPEKWDDYYLDEFERLQRSEKEYYLDQAFERYKSGDANIGPKYGEYQFPGGENYREILLKLPDTSQQARENLRKFQDEMKQKYGRLDWRRAAGADDQYLHDKLLAAEKQETYRSSHWEDPNVLAHMRVSDRVGPNGEKVLHVEEIQSDWHQAGRQARDKEVKRIMQEKGISKKEASALVPESFGYAQSETKRIRGVVQPDEYGGYKVAWEDGTFSGGYSKEGAEAKALEGKSNATSGVPDAPFKKNWQELAMNRLLSYAAENGYDRVALTPGAEQASRYDLSKQVSSVMFYTEPGSETGVLRALDLHGEPVIKETVPVSKLDEYIGKEAASKLLDQTPIPNEKTGLPSELRTLNGVDLQVGGEGMKGFYDKMLPDYLNKLGKKYGVEVDTMPLTVPPKDSMAVSKYPGGEDYIMGKTTWSEFLAQNPEAAKDFQSGLHSFQITPEMRKDITEQGFPLYSAIAAPVGLGAVQQDVLPKVGITDNEDAMKLDLMDQELREPEQGFADGGAAFGVFPQMKGKRSKQDREASKNVPVDLLRGAVSGVLGAPGDIESLIRLLPGLNEETVLPTSEDIEKRLPFKSDTPVSQAATGLGQLAGGFYTGPGSPLKAIAGVPKAIKHGAEEFAKATAMGAPRLDVWHGSPHKFPPTAKNPLGEFDPTKIGTGEGAQQYGVGHYTAEAKKVGSSYRPRSPEYEEKLIGLYNKAQSSSNYPMMEVLEDAMMHSDPEDILKRFTGVDSGYTPAHAKAAQDFAKWYAKNPPEVGSLYRVDLSDEAIAKMLDYDKPINEQAPEVLELLERAGINTQSSAKAGTMIGGQEQHLAKHGIPGVKYLDDASREAGEGTRNFVVFPGGEDLLNIVESKAEGGRVKPPSEEMREKLRQLRESFLPAANEAERQKRMQQNMEQTTRKVSFTDNPDEMRDEVHLGKGGLLKKAMQSFINPEVITPSARAATKFADEAPAATEIFIGPNAKTWNQAAADRALKMEKAGEDPAKIWQQTGTFRGADGVLRQEISDRSAKFVTPDEQKEKVTALKEKMQGLKEQIRPTPQKDLFPKALTEAKKGVRGDIANLKDEISGRSVNPRTQGIDAQYVFEHPELYQAYPELKNLNVTVGGRGGDTKGALSIMEKDINRPGVMQMDVYDEALTKNPTSTTLHEMQHAVQTLERMGPGGSPRMAFADPKAYEILERMRAEALKPATIEEFNKANRYPENEVEAAYQQYLKTFPKELSRSIDRDLQSRAAMEYYKRLAGEAEARAVQDRQMMTPAERLENPPPSSYDFPQEDLIVKPPREFAGGGEIKASPRNEAWGTAADIAKALEEASKSQFGYSNPATEKIAELFGLPGLARTLERKAYGQPITNIGKANVGVLPDDTVDALLAVAPLGKPIAKGAKAAAKAAAGEVEKAMFGESSSKLLNELTPQVMSAYKPHTPLKPDPEVGTRYKVTDTGGLAPRKDLNIEDLQNSQVKIFPWDATSRNKLVTEVSDVPLTKPVLTEGGDDYMRDLKHIEQGIAGASNRGIANRIMGRINQAAVENQLLGGGTGRVFGFPIRMAEKAEYAATFPTDVALDLLKQAGLKKKELKALDENMRNMVFDGERGAFKDMAPFGSPEFEYQLRHGLKSDKQKDIKGFTDMNLRKAFMDRMSMVENQKRMGYNIQDLTGSVLAEELKGVPKGYVGNVAAELEPYGKLRPSKSSTYDTDFPGLYVGSMPNMPVEFLMPRTFENIYREMKALYPHKTQEALRNMTIGAMEKRNKGISEKIEQRAVDTTKTYQEGLMKGEFDPNDLTQVYDYMRRKKLELKLAKGGSTGLIEVKKRKAKA